VPIMFSRLGDQTAMSVFGVLGLVCMPIPFLFWASAAFGVHRRATLLTTPCRDMGDGSGANLALHSRNLHWIPVLR
jgi:hypothetical protein